MADRYGLEVVGEHGKVQIDERYAMFKPWQSGTSACQAGYNHIPITPLDNKNLIFGIKPPTSGYAATYGLKGDIGSGEDKYITHVTILSEVAQSITWRVWSPEGSPTFPNYGFVVYRDDGVPTYISGVGCTQMVGQYLLPRADLDFWCVEAAEGSGQESQGQALTDPLIVQPVASAINNYFVTTGCAYVRIVNWDGYDYIYQTGIKWAASNKIQAGPLQVLKTPTAVEGGPHKKAIGAGLYVLEFTP